MSESESGSVCCVSVWREQVEMGEKMNGKEKLEVVSAWMETVWMAQW